ncbi:MAG: DNA polymerase III subunit beta [Psychromonas sp.]|nr:DNA polymerase III subunit beta [Psychromonas sp.]
MQFTINRENLLKPLQLVVGTVSSGRAIQPITSNILIKVENNLLSLTGTDLEVELMSKIPLNIDSASGSLEGEITVPARKLLDICRGLPESCEISFSLKNEKVTIRSGKSRYLLSTLPSVEFPNIEALKSLTEFDIPSNEFKKLISSTQFAMANQDVRYYLNGMYFEVTQDTLRSVATDGHRLASNFINLAPTNIETQQTIIVPSKGIKELFKLLDNESPTLTLQISLNNLRVLIGDYIFTTKLVDGRFPDYRRVIPRDGDKVVIADRGSLKQAFTRAAILSNEKFRGVRLALSANELKITANNQEREEAMEMLKVDYQSSDLEIGFNVSYVLDALGTLKSEKVKMTFSTPSNSALIEAVDDSDDSLYVLMPMRL